ncbi:MAG: alpha/beta hydrolase [Gammaproteobacteria bacterium]|nr:alpha/beta hydrolase [Gammaproteobacteria bacterium]
MNNRRTQKVKTRDLVYAKAGDLELLARCYSSENSIGHGIVMVHGGAWTVNDRSTPWFVSESLARNGLTVLSLDFRCGPDHQHPTASCDVVAGVRFLRQHAKAFKINPASIGLIGSSSGGHLALFAGLNSRRSDHQSTRVSTGRGSFANAEEISAAPTYIVALWPVSDPLYRYEFAKATGRDDLVQAHDGYYKSLDCMADACVQRTLRSGEADVPPPVMIVQPGNDANVPKPMTLDLIDALQERECEVTYRFMPGLPHAFAYKPSPESEVCCDYVWNFIRENLCRMSSNAS